MVITILSINIDKSLTLRHFKAKKPFQFHALSIDHCKKNQKMQETYKTKIPNTSNQTCLSICFSSFHSLQEMHYLHLKSTQCHIHLCSHPCLTAYQIIDNPFKGWDAIQEQLQNHIYSFNHLSTFVQTYLPRYIYNIIYFDTIQNIYLI